MEEVNKPTDADAEELDELFEEEGTETEAGTTDVEGKGDLNQMSLEELNNISGRKFESKDAFFKHYENLKKFVGDQDLAKQRKEAPKEEPDKQVADELAQLKKDLAKKDFLIETPTAKPFIDALEAYADKQGMNLGEAWNSEAFSLIAETSQRASKHLTTNNRIAPVQNKKLEQLKDEVISTGSETAKINLVKEYFKS